MWNIDAAVGKNKPNKPDDVRLVQAMLIAIVASARTSPVMVPYGITATGTFDSRTEDLIKGFQTTMNQKYPGKYRPDGVVTPMHSPERVDWTLRSSDGGSSTMAALNFVLRAYSKETHQSIGVKLAERLL